MAMTIQLINPNTTAAMTAQMVTFAQPLVRPDTEIIGVTNSAGPASIEGHYDEALSVPGLLHAVREGEASGVSGHVIACFGDPGLLAAREIATQPVIGIAEAAMHVATWLATGFSIVTTLERTCVIAHHLAGRYGFNEQCKGIHAVEIAVLELDADPDALYERMRLACEQALLKDGSGAIVLGCAGMAPIAARLQDALDVPVIDGVGAALNIVELLASLNLRTSKRGDLAYPLAKPYSGFLGFLQAGTTSSAEVTHQKNRGQTTI